MIEIKLIVIILVLAISPFLVNDAFAVPVTTRLLPTNIVVPTAIAPSSSPSSCGAVGSTFGQGTLTRILISASSASGSPETCNFPIFVFDITTIPDNATPINGTLQINIT